MVMEQAKTNSVALTLKISNAPSSLGNKLNKLNKMTAYQENTHTQAKWILMEKWMNKSLKIHSTTSALPSLNFCSIYCLHKAITVRYLLLEYILYNHASSTRFSRAYISLGCPITICKLQEDKCAALYFSVLLMMLSIE